jgi:hypothetical protein
MYVRLKNSAEGLSAEALLGPRVYIGGADLQGGVSFADLEPGRRVRVRFDKKSLPLVVKEASEDFVVLVGIDN